MPGRLRAYGMDKAAIWHCDCVVLEPLDVRPSPTTYDVRALAN